MGFSHIYRFSYKQLTSNKSQVSSQCLPTDSCQTSGKMFNELQTEMNLSRISIFWVIRKSLIPWNKTFFFFFLTKVFIYLRMGFSTKSGTRFIFFSICAWCSECAFRLLQPTQNKKGLWWVHLQSMWGEKPQSSSAWDYSNFFLTTKLKLPLYIAF